MGSWRERGTRVPGAEARGERDVGGLRKVRARRREEEGQEEQRGEQRPFQLDAVCLPDSERGQSRQAGEIESCATRRQELIRPPSEQADEEERSLIEATAGRGEASLSDEEDEEEVDWESAGTTCQLAQHRSLPSAARA